MHFIISSMFHFEDIPWTVGPVFSTTLWITKLEPHVITLMEMSAQKIADTLPPLCVDLLVLRNKWRKLSNLRFFTFFLNLNRSQQLHLGHICSRDIQDIYILSRDFSNSLSACQVKSPDDHRQNNIQKSKISRISKAKSDILKQSEPCM